MTIVFKVSENIKEKMIEYYSDKKKVSTPPYAIFQATEADTVITLYESGKVMFQGISADIDANMWRDLEKHINNIDVDTRSTEEKKEEKIDKTNYYFNAIGSDEVGTGDYFLPIVVTATFITKEDIKFLEELGVHDSKKLTDEKIKRCAPLIIKRIPYESLILTNKEYNEYHSKGYNMNKIKAIMHNKVLFKMKNKNLPYQKIIVDQFALPGVYFNYLRGITNKVTNITFLTKAEDKNLSVACASIISRYIFLKEQKSLEEKLGCPIPKGAGTKVDEAGTKLIKTHGKEIINEIAKISFKNTERITEK